jgi:hypothetical protein
MWVKNFVKTLVDDQMGMIETEQDKKEFLLRLATYSFALLVEHEGKERAAMAAYAIGDRIVDANTDQSEKKLLK